MALVLALGTLIGTGRRFFDACTYIQVKLANETMEKGWRETDRTRPPC